MYKKTGTFQVKSAGLFLLFLQKNRFALAIGIICPQNGKIETKAKNR
jgi:hypothetical protein